MSAQQFILLLEEQGLLDPEVIVELRDSVREAKHRITAESLAKLLVENGQLTRFQATRLVSQIQAGQPEAGVKPFSSPVSPATKVPPPAGDELELLTDEMLASAQHVDPNRPVEGRLIDQPPANVPSREQAAEPSPLEVVVDSQEVTAREEPSVEPDTRRGRKKESAANAGKTDSGAHRFDTPTPTFVKPVKIAGTKASSWDAFRIWGVGFILSVLLLALSWLVFWVISGSSDQFYKQAEEAYESRDYEVAVERFQTFAKKFPKEGKASAARAFAAIATIRQASDQKGNPAEAVDQAELILPTLLGESSLNDAGIRADLASALVSIAEKMVERADAAKTTEDRKKLVDKLDKHLLAVRNPQYIPNANRLTNESRIKTVEESRARILRDIQRAEDLVAAVDVMKKSIAANDVEAAYQARRSVVRKYPQLEGEKELLALLEEATKLQQQAVVPASEKPLVVEASADAPVGRVGILVKQSLAPAKEGAKGAAVDPETILFVRAKGSIYALRGTDGQILWRRHIGFENVGEPLRFTPDPRSDCLVVKPKDRRLMRLAGADGSLVWELEFPARLLNPTIDGQTIFVTTEDGKVYSLDAETGQTRWGRTVPQKIAVESGGAVNKPARYVVGEHSNIYVLSRSDGACSEVYYLGHAAGTISVPPVHALGHLFIFHNTRVGESTIHVLKTDEQGNKLQAVQTPIRLAGHVVVPPSQEGRRLVVMTDLGETVIYDIEPGSNRDKLTRVAGVVANEKQPRLAWPAISSNELWIVANRFSRFQIQVSAQKLVRQWVREDEDQFTGRPFKMEDYIVHTRVVRGTEGIRVTAAMGQTGDPVWEVDLGVPVVALKPRGSGGLVAVNSQAALFAVDSSLFSGGKPLNAKENPGRNQRLLNFADTAELPDGRLAITNTHQGNQVAVFDPKGSEGLTMSVKALQLSNGIPSAAPVAVKDGLVVPLDNAQLVYVDPATGKQLGTPFQPTLEAGGKTRWVSPVVLADGSTLIAASDQKKIYRLTVSPQLQETAQVASEFPFVQRLAVAGDLVCGVGRGEAIDVLEIYRGADLSKMGSLEVNGRIVWGPFAMGQSFAAFSESSGLMACSDKGELLWSCPLEKESLVGAPVEHEGDWLVNSASGNLYRVDGSSGKLKATIRVGEPLAGSPFILGSGLLLPGSEGVLVAVPLAKTMTSAGEGER